MQHITTDAVMNSEQTPITQTQVIYNKSSRQTHMDKRGHDRECSDRLRWLAKASVGSLALRDVRRAEEEARLAEEARVVNAKVGATRADEEESRGTRVRKPADASPTRSTRSKRRR
jgi:hypothetical protein